MSINKIHTCCKNCVFAVYSDKTQTSCDLDYINKYKNADAEIIEAYDDELEFYIVNNKKCVGYREDAFFKKLGITDHQEKINHIISSNKIEYLCIINLYNFSIDNLKQLVQPLRELSIKPKKIIFVRYNSKPAVFGYNAIKEILRESEVDCEWRIQTMVTDDLSYSDILHNITNLNKKYRFIMSINNPVEQIDNVIRKANNIVYDDLKGFNVIADKSKDVVVFSGATYRYSYIVEKKNLLEQEENYILI